MIYTPMTNSQGERVRSVRFAHDITEGYAHTFRAATAANVDHWISFRFPWKFCPASTGAPSVFPFPRNPVPTVSGSRSYCRLFNCTRARTRGPRTVHRTISLSLRSLRNCDRDVRRYATRRRASFSFLLSVFPFLFFSLPFRGTPYAYEWASGTREGSEERVVIVSVRSVSQACNSIAHGEFASQRLTESAAKYEESPGFADLPPLFFHGTFYDAPPPV